MVLPDLLPLSGVLITVDALGGVFLAITGGVAVAVGDLRHRVLPAARPGQPSWSRRRLPLFVTAMMLVPVAGSVGTFLLCWELMALTSLLLVIAEHRSRPAVARAGRWYAVMTHLGMVAILIGLLVFSANAVDGSFPALRDAASGLSPTVAGLIFVATGIGFGSKAGIVPLHAWLPRAHPEAPSNVSALMSAAMVNLGVYGIIRVGFDLLGGAQDGAATWWWLLVLTLGAVSAIYGILQAAIGTDLKRLLGTRRPRTWAWSSSGSAPPGCSPPPGTCRWPGWRWRPRCCTWSTMRRSRPCCSSPPGRCWPPPAAATWTTWAGCAPGCPAPQPLSASARWPRRRCRRVRRSSANGCCCRP